MNALASCGIDGPAACLVTIFGRSASPAGLADSPSIGGRIVALPAMPAGVLFMGHIGIPELLVILFIVIIIFGASRLPELGKGLGKGIKNFKEATRDGANDKTDL
jgi:sec-independent protein translocase protein TatA